MQPSHLPKDSNCWQGSWLIQSALSLIYRGQMDEGGCACFHGQGSRFQLGFWLVEESCISQVLI